MTMTVNLPVLDFSVSAPNFQQVADAGYVAVGCYIGAGSLDKRLNAAERDRIFAAGLGIYLLCEGGAGDYQFGAPMGRTHANLVLSDYARLGIPRDKPTYFAIDQQVTTAAGLLKVKDYMTGASSVMGVSCTGDYGSALVCKYCSDNRLATYAYQTLAWSNGTWWTGDNIRQEHNGMNLFGGNVDIGHARTLEFGQWNGDDMTFGPKEQKELQAALAEAECVINNDPNVVAAWSTVDPTAVVENKTHTALVALHNAVADIVEGIGPTETEVRVWIRDEIARSTNTPAPIVE